MNDKDSYNPFEDSHWRITQTLSTISDDVSVPKPKNTEITVNSDAINDFTPFTDVTMFAANDFEAQGNSTVATTNFEVWQNDFEARSQRVADLEDLQQHRKASHGATANFPPFPQCCRIKPCFYQDIDVEIPEIYRPIVKFAYGLWICYCVALLLNVIGSMTVLIAFSSVPGLSTNVPTLFGVSILLLILFVPLSYLFWFRRLYVAFKTNSSLHFAIFFLMFSLCIVSLVVEVIGIPQCGVCGWILVFMTKDKTGIMVFMMLIAMIFTSLMIASLYLILKVNIYFRSSGGSFNQAKQELTTNAKHSETFKSAVLGTFTPST